MTSTVVFLHSTGLGPFMWTPYQNLAGDAKVLTPFNRGYGPGDEVARPEQVRRLQVDLSGPGVLQTVVTSQAHFLGPLQKTDQNLRFLKWLGGGAPRSQPSGPRESFSADLDDEIPF